GSRISLMQTTTFTRELLDAQMHRDDAIEIFAQVVPADLRLRAALLVGGARHDRVIAGRVRLPQVRPALPQPAIGRMLDVRRLPALAAVDAHLDLDDLPLAAPREPADR